MTLTGDPRRWANEPGSSASSATRTRTAGERRSRGPSPRASRASRTSSATRAPQHDRGGLPRDDRRHERHPHPARRLHPGRPRDLRPQRHPDGRRRGDGRLRADRAAGSRSTTGTCVPDLMTMAKGLTSSYLPLGAVAMRHEIAEHFENQMSLRRPDLQQPPGQPARRRSPRSRSTRRTACIENARPARRGHARAPRRALRRRHPWSGRPEPRPVRDHRPRPHRAIRGRR